MAEHFPRVHLWFLRAGAAKDLTSEVTRMVTFYVVSAVTGAVGGYVSSQTEDPSIVLVVGMALVGILTPLVVVFLWFLSTMPRRTLQWQINDLTEEVERMQGDFATLAQHVYGDPQDLRPVFHDLRTDLREAMRMIEVAVATGQLWSYSQKLDDGVWKRHQATLGKSAYAQPIYGVLVEAFGHFERIRRAEGLRIRNRRVRVSDDLGEAFEACERADAALTDALGETPGQLEIEEESA